MDAGATRARYEMLFSYLQRTRVLLNDQTLAKVNEFDLISFINSARLQVASEGQCVRALSVASSPVTSLTITDGGSGYTSAPTVTITPPSLQQTANATATATATLTADAVTGLTLTNAGGGYIAAPSVTFSGGGGSGAAATAAIGNIWQTYNGQQIYNFSDIVLPSGQGLSQVLAVGNMSVIWSTYRYTMTRYSWSLFQSKINTYTSGYLYIPWAATQFGQGVSGSMYVYPIPNDSYPMEWDCTCLPSQLTTDADVEAIPYPWTDAVPYYAAYLAIDALAAGEPGAYPGASVERIRASDRKYQLYERYMHRARAFSQRTLVMNPYGRP